MCLTSPYYKTVIRTPLEAFEKPVGCVDPDYKPPQLARHAWRASLVRRLFLILLNVGSPISTILQELPNLKTPNIGPNISLRASRRPTQSINPSPLNKRPTLDEILSNTVRAQRAALDAKWMRRDIEQMVSMWRHPDVLDVSLTLDLILDYL
jgi:hypothetical protein